MHASSLLTYVSLAATVAANAYEVMLFHDNGCTDFMENRTINYLSCTSPETGFSSMLFPSPESGHIRVYSGNACAGSLGTEYSITEWQGRCAGFDTCNSASFEV